MKKILSLIALCACFAVAGHEAKAEALFSEGFDAYKIGNTYTGNGQTPNWNVGASDWLVYMNVNDASAYNLSGTSMSGNVGQFQNTFFGATKTVLSSNKGIGLDAGKYRLSFSAANFSTTAVSNLLLTLYDGKVGGGVIDSLAVALAKGNGESSPSSVVDFVLDFTLGGATSLFLDFSFQSASAFNLALDNITLVAQAAATPIPAAAALLLPGMALLGVIQRRRGGQR